MKILFVQPPKTEGTISTVDMMLSEPLALEVLAANLPGHDVKILDMRLDPDLEGTLSSFKPDIVGTTAFTVEIYKASGILKKAKEYNRDVLTVIGGQHATLSPEDFSKEYIDIVAIGEGEYLIQEIVEARENNLGYTHIKGLGLRVDGKFILTGARETIADLNILPFADRKLTSAYRDKYHRGVWKPVASIFSSRGCPFRCDYCAMWKLFKGQFRVREAKNFVDELEMLPEKYISFADDNTLQNITYAESIYSEIKKRNIKKSYKIYGRSDTIVKHPEIVDMWKSIGMELIFIGLEAIKDEDLKNRNKKNTVENNEKAIKILHDKKVEIVGSFLVDQSFTEKDFKDMSEYVISRNLIHPVFTILTPFPGTDLYEKRRHEITTTNFELFDIFHSVLPTKLPLKEFYANFINLYRSSYSRHDNKFLNDTTITALLSNLMSGHGLN